MRKDEMHRPRQRQSTGRAPTTNTFRVRPRSHGLGRPRPGRNWLKIIQSEPESVSTARACERSIPLPLGHARTTMSFAGRRRGNKVKKGVQFTVMVVGQSFLGHILFLTSSTSFYLCTFRRLWHRTYHFREHPLRVRGPISQGFRQPRDCARGGRHQDQAC